MVDHSSYTSISPGGRKELTVTEEKQLILQEIKENYPDIYQQIGGSNGLCWTTDELTEEFEVTSFMAPYCFAIRRKTGEKGSFTFLHMPRIYYNWRIA